MGTAGVAGRGALDWAPAATTGRRSKGRGVPVARGGRSQARRRPAGAGRGRCGAGGTGAGHGERLLVAANGGRARRRELARERPGGEGGHRQAQQCARVRAGETGRGGAAMGAFRGAGARVRTASWRPRAAGGTSGHWALLTMG
nr:translation initiation factor IF-2-like [Aegilops tauschii subsp. strangulata]